MAPNLHSSLCLDEIQQKDTHLTLTTTIDIMEPMKVNSIGENLQIMEASYKTSKRNAKKK